MKREVGGGKEREAPMYLIENSTFSHAARVTTNRHNRIVCSQEAEVTEKPGAHNPLVRFVTKDPRILCHEQMEHSYYLSKSDSKMNASFTRETGSDKRSPLYL